MSAGQDDKLSSVSPIPQKLYFKIGEVSRLVGVRAHVLRYWEKEISAIRPTKSASNQRRYRRRDVELFREIRRLLYEERYTLAGARKRLLKSGQGARKVDESAEHSARGNDEHEEVVGRCADVAATPSSEAEASDTRETGGVCSAEQDRLDRLRFGLVELIRWVHDGLDER